jgi:putative Mg2+ transporter-C (MgtC) family protein
MPRLTIATAVIDMLSEVHMSQAAFSCLPLTDRDAGVAGAFTCLATSAQRIRGTLRSGATFLAMDLFVTLGGHHTVLPTLEATLRVLFAIVAGSLIGLDRELRNKPAGLRTHILISLAAALFTLITFELHEQFTGDNGSKTADPVRIIEAVTAGVAFLAAGAIIQSRGSVHGLTTGANMWLAGALGVACGAGYYFLATIGTAFAVVVLVLLAKLEQRLSRKSRHEEAPEPAEGEQRSERRKADKPHF